MPTPFRIALLDDYQDVGLTSAEWQRLPAHCEVIAFADHLDDTRALVERLEPFHAVMAMRERTAFTAELMTQLPHLKLISTAGMRNAAIDVAAANQFGITVSGTGGSPRDTAELTWALIFALVRHLPREFASVASGGWQETVGLGLAGRRLGLIGLGRIGGQVAEVAKALQMEVVAWSENLTTERAAEHAVTRVDKDTLLATADVVSIHLKLSGRTTGLLGGSDLDKLKSSAFLVNTSRGPIVDEDALLSALQRRQFAGAGLDVFGEEPLPPASPWRALAAATAAGSGAGAAVVLTPHIGYVTADTYARFYGDTLANVEAFLAGKPIRELPANS